MNKDNNENNPSFKKFGARHKARKRALDLLFEAEMKGVSVTDLMQERKHLKNLDDDLPGVPEYTETILNGVSVQRTEIDETITTALKDWEFSRLPKVDRAILRLATWEILYNGEVPSKVAIDEAIELAKVNSTDKSADFINGVLGNIKLSC